MILFSMNEHKSKQKRYGERLNTQTEWTNKLQQQQQKTDCDYYEYKTKEKK